MFLVRFDTKQINKILNNSVSYSYGFLEGVDIEQIFFNQRLAQFTVEALEKYIDSQARINPESLHHVYEWNQVGNPEERLFKIKADSSKRTIKITGSFLPSRSTSDTSMEPFVNKAEIMENSIDIVIEPKNSEVLSFEIDGEQVFTTSYIYIASPGGDDVAGSFAKVVEDFFDNYFTNAFIQPLIMQLSNPKEFSRSFNSGATGGGRQRGIKSGRKYLKLNGIDAL